MRRLTIFLTLGLGIVSVRPLRAESSEETQSKFFVIVHPDNNLQEISSRFLAAAFLKKMVQWPDGETIQPIDLDQRSPIRRYFTESILNRSISDVKNYWQQLIFSGRGLPPPEFDSDSIVLAYVLQNPGAVGYVSSNTNIGNAKILTVK